MPQGDRTGPMGQGSRTGKALGFCSGNDAPGFAKGFGFGRGRGRGRSRGYNFGLPFTGFFHGFPSSQSVSKDDEIKLLKSQSETLKRSQKDIEKRLSELEKEGE